MELGTAHQRLVAKNTGTAAHWYIFVRESEIPR
jgi:hypothetical protein